MSAIAGAAPLGLVQPQGLESALPKATPSASEGGVPFADVFGRMVASANADQIRSNDMADAFAAGRADDIHGTMIAVKEDDISMRLTATVRNKVVDAFYELWRMNV